MSNIEGAPLPEPEPHPPVMVPTPEPQPAETALVVDPGFIEGDFTEVVPPAVAQAAPGKPVEAVKRKISPAMLALFTILGLFALCCLMALIVFLMVLPAIREQSAALLPLLTGLAG
jgi:hypothetical protein